MVRHTSILTATFPRNNPSEKNSPPWRLIQYTVKSEHPAEELLELFALRRLPADKMMELFRHLDDCETCRAALKAEYEFIEAIRAALSRQG